MIFQKKQKNHSKTGGESRREFLRSSLRWFTLAGLGTLVGSFYARGITTTRNKHCTDRGICRRCQEFSDCGLPQALSAKEVLDRRKK